MDEPHLVGFGIGLVMLSVIFFLLPIYLIVEWHWAAILLVVPLYPLGFLVGAFGIIAFAEGV